jgi:hypothetical protein
MGGRGNPYAGLPGGHYSVVLNFSNNPYIPAGEKYLLRATSGVDGARNQITSAIDAIISRLKAILNLQKAIYEQIKAKYNEGKHSQSFEDFLLGMRFGGKNDQSAEVLKQ